MNNPLDTYTSLSFSLFPCKRNGKVPLTEHGFKNASDNPDTIAKLFAPHTTRNGDITCNVGVATGDKSGFFALDIDIKDGKRGAESLKHLTDEYGELPLTVSAQTWSGGLHYLFKMPIDIPIGCKIDILPGIDIKGNGGYIIVWPSIIKGKPYVWTNHPDDVMIADAPEWLLQLIQKSNHIPLTDLSAPDQKITTNRNDTLMKQGVKLRKMGLDAAAIEHTLQHINKKRCSPMLPIAEVTKIAVSVSKYEAAQIQYTQLNDLWNSTFFKEQNGENIRYCSNLGGWFQWEKTHWGKDNTDKILETAKETINTMRQLAINKDDKHLLKHCNRSATENKIKSMINLTRGNGISMQTHQFDTNHYLFNCKNGTLNLKTGELLPHNRQDYITKLAPVQYDPGAKCPNWDKFIAETFPGITSGGDMDLISYMQKAVGYSLSGDTSEQCFFILYGTGMNGKSTFLKHIYNIMGDYAITTPASTLMERQNDTVPNDIARLKGVRLVMAAESGQRKRLNEALLKQLTGGEPISARFLHKEFFDFYATFKIFLITNHKPVIRGTDLGIRRRIILVPFDNVISPSRIDPDLDAKLMGEYPGILAWIFRGFQAWNSTGLKITTRIEEMREDYENESDIIGQFIKERCKVGFEEKVLSSRIWHGFRAWMVDSNYKWFKKSDLFEYLKNHEFERITDTGGEYKGCQIFLGISLKYTDA